MGTDPGVSGLDGNAKAATAARRLCAAPTQARVQRGLALSGIKSRNVTVEDATHF